MSDRDQTSAADPLPGDNPPPTQAPTTDPAASLDSLRTQAPPTQAGAGHGPFDASIPNQNPSDTYATATPDFFSATRGLAPPEDFPGYELLGTLGEGGMGVVYRARQLGLNRVVALKAVLGGLRAEPKDLIRFLAEAEAVASVKHPHVVQVHEYGEAGGRPFLAMEYLPGGSLADRLKSGRLEPRPAAELVAKLARGVQVAHDQEIVHRDLKPGNVLFDAQGEPKVTDFGLAKRPRGSDLTLTQAVMGTPAYMSPEQAAGKSKFVGPPADVYALGVVLYECLTGTRPFVHEDTLVLLCRVLVDDPESPSRRVPGLPRDLELIALKCLAKDPADRYPTAGALAEDLGRFVAGEPVTVHAASSVERALKWARRKPTLATSYALTAAVAVLLVIGATLTGFWKSAERARTTAEVAQRNAETSEDRARRERGIAETARDKEQRARADFTVATEKSARVEYGRAVQLAYRESEKKHRGGAFPA